MSYIQDAFNATCKSATLCGNTHYVCLMESSLYYGGPEEGGWWGADTILIAFQEFQTEELANQAAEKVKILALELEEESRKEFGEQCLRELEWLEARGLDSDYLPEVDGESKYYVRVCDELPVAIQRGCRQYS